MNVHLLLMCFAKAPLPSLVSLRLLKPYQQLKALLEVSWLLKLYKVTRQQIWFCFYSTFTASSLPLGSIFNVKTKEGFHNGGIEYGSELKLQLRAVSPRQQQHYTQQRTHIQRRCNCPQLLTNGKRQDVKIDFALATYRQAEELLTWFGAMHQVGEEWQSSSVPFKSKQCIKKTTSLLHVIICYLFLHLLIFHSTPSTVTYEWCTGDSEF